MEAGVVGGLRMRQAKDATARTRPHSQLHHALGSLVPPVLDPVADLDVMLLVLYLNLLLLLFDQLRLPLEHRLVSARVDMEERAGRTRMLREAAEAATETNARGSAPFSQSPTGQPLPTHPWTPPTSTHPSPALTHVPLAKAPHLVLALRLLPLSLFLRLLRHLEGLGLGRQRRGFGGGGGGGDSRRLELGLRGRSRRRLFHPQTLLESLLLSLRLRLQLGLFLRLRRTGSGVDG